MEKNTLIVMEEAVELVRDRELVVAMAVDVGVGGPTWESGEWTSVIDYMLFGRPLEVVKMVVEDPCIVDFGLDHNLIWGEVLWRRAGVSETRGVQMERDGRLD